MAYELTVPTDQFEAASPLVIEQATTRQSVFVNVTALGWVGTRTDRAESLARFYADVLGLRLIIQLPDFWVFELPDGRHVEVFGPGDTDHEHFTTGPVVGFAVDDLTAAVDELRSRNVELLGNPGPTWQHFRAPDGNVYELVAATAS